MSADNGVYIGKFNDGYRVVHAQAIENCFPHSDFPDELSDWYVALIFGKAKLFHSREEARTEAFRIYDQIMDSDYPIVEYGVSELTFERDFPKISSDEACQKIEQYWEDYQSRKRVVEPRRQ